MPVRIADTRRGEFLHQDPTDPPETFRRRRWRPIGGIVALSGAALVLLAAAFPWGWFASSAAGPLSRALGRPVTIGSAHRIDHFSFTPTIEFRDVVIAQPGWAGPGAMARIGAARVRLAALPLLWGEVRLRSLDLAGVRLELRRDASGRSNWAGAPETSPSTRRGLDLSHLTLRDARAHLIDRKRHVDLTGNLVSDSRGFVVRAVGRFRGQPLSLAMRGAPLVNASVPYPASVAIVSPLVRVTGTLRMARPLSLDRFDARLHVAGRDLTYFDDLVEAGLFPTQAFDLTGSLRHDPSIWRIDRLDGRVGRSRLALVATVRRGGERTFVDGRVRAATLDFSDFASDQQRARGAARDRATGPRVVPDTRIELDGLRKLDGTLQLHADRLLGSDRSPFRALEARVVLDRRRLEVAPMFVRLRSGSARGRLVVDDRGAAPRLSMDVTVGGGATIEKLLLGGDALTGPLAARLRLAGTGTTVRAAMARSTGKVGLTVRDGSMRRDYATFLGGDLLKSIGAFIEGGERRIAVPCLVVRFAAAGGRLSPAPFVLDTPVARGDGSGSIDLGSERISLAVTGRAARPGLLQLSTPVRIVGTLSDPKFDIRPPRALPRKKTGILARLGSLVEGLKIEDHPQPAPPTDCRRLSREALN